MVGSAPDSRQQYDLRTDLGSYNFLGEHAPTPYYFFLRFTYKFSQTQWPTWCSSIDCVLAVPLHQTIPHVYTESNLCCYQALVTYIHTT